MSGELRHDPHHDPRHDLERLPGPVGQGFLEHASAPRNQGALPRPDGRAMGVGTCGDSIEVHLKLEAGVIAEVRAEPRGCIYTVVCASAVSELAKGLSLEKALELGPEDVERVLGGLPEDHLHCARLAVNTLGEAVADCYHSALSPVRPGARTGEV